MTPADFTYFAPTLEQRYVLWTLALAGYVVWKRLLGRVIR